MKDNYDDITAHPIKGYRGEDIYNDSEKARKIAAAQQYVKSVNQAVKNENKGHVGYEALQDPNVTKVNTVYGVDYGKSKYDKSLLLNPSLQTIQNYRADEQSAASKIINGVGKGVVLAGTTFLSGLGFWAYGVPTAIFSSRKDDNGKRVTAGQQWSKLWDNEFTRGLQQINDAAEEMLPNYYTTYEQNNPLGHIFSANFLGDKFLKNIGFMVGAFASGNVIGTLTKLSRLPALMANITGKLSTAKNVTTAIGAFSSAVGEGAIEALNNSRDWAEYQRIGIEENYNKQIQDVYNSAISQQEKEALIIQLNEQKQKELENLEKEKARMGNMNLLLNIPILTFSNVLQFARLYSGGYNTARKLGHLIARNQGQQFTNINARSAAKAFGKTFMSEGSEEFLQRVASSTSGNYYDDNIEQFRRSFIDPQANEDVANALTRFMQSSAQAWSENIKDPTAIEEFLIGGLSGMLGMPSFGRANTKNAWLGKDKMVGLSGGIVGQFQESKDEYLRANRYMEEINKMIQNGNIPTYFRGLSAQAFYDGKLQQNLEDENAFEYKNNELSQLVSQVITFDNAGKLSDLETMVNSALSDLTDQDLEAIYNETKKEDGTSVFDVNNESPLLTEEGKQSMRQKLENTRNKILNVIKDYRRISENLDIEFGEALSDEQLAELTWMQTTIADQTRRIDSVYGDIKTPLLQFLNNTNIQEKTREQYRQMGLLRTVYKGNRTLPKGSTVTVNEDGTVKVVNSENKAESKFPKGTQYKTNEDGSISLTFESLTKPKQNYTTEEKFIVDFAKDEIDKAEELDTLITKAKEILQKSPDEAAEYLSSNSGLLNLMHIINDLYNDDVTSKKDINTKLDDLTKLYKFRDAFKKRATDYAENPGKSAEEIEELKKKIQQEERDKKVEQYKKDLKEAKTVKEFSKVFENIPSEFQKEVIDSLIKEGNTIAKSYQEMSEYRKDILTDLQTAAIDKSINTDYQKLIRSLAGYLFDEVIFSNSNSLDEVSNPNRVNGIKVSSDLEIFINMPEDQKNLVTQYAKYILQESIVAMNNKTAFKNRIKAEYKKPTTAVTSPITNTDNSGTTKIPTIDAPLLENSKDVILDILSKSKSKNTQNIEKAKKQIEEFFEQLDKVKNSDDLKKLKNLISSITSSIHSLVSREQKSQIADMLFDNHETKEKEIMNSVARLLEDDVEISVDEIHITNKEDRSDKLYADEKGKPHEFYVPTLKEYNKGVREADVSNITFTEEQKKHIQALYKYLIDQKAFEYVSLGKLKEGDKVYFIIDPTISQNSDYEGIKSDTIFLAVESGGKHQIIGSIQDLQGAISKFKGLQDLIDDITREYDSTSKDKKFVYSKTSTVNSNKIGSLLITENELTVKEIFNNTEDQYKKGILFGFMKDARIKIPGDPDIEIQDWIPDSKNKEGRMYMLLPTNKYVNGKRVYYPVAVRTKRFSKEFYTEDQISRFKTALTDILNRSNGQALPESFFSGSDVIINRTIDNILGCIVDLTNAKNKSDVISAQNKLSRYLYMYYQSAENNFDINFDYFQHSENADRQGKGISISRYPLRRDSNGLRLGRQKGDTLQLEARVYDNSNKTPQDRAEELLDAILKLNLQFSTRKQELQNLNESKNPSNYSLIRDELITSDIEKAQVVNAWFTIDYYDALSNEGKGGFVTASPTRNVGNQKTQPSKTNATNTAVFTHNNREYKLYTENGISVVMVDGTKLNSKLSYLISSLYVVQDQFTPNNEVVLNGVKYYKILYTQKGENKIGFVKSLDTINNLQDIKDNEIKDIFISTLSNKDLHTTLLNLFNSKNNPAPVQEDKQESEEKTKKKKEEDRPKIPAINMVLNQTQSSVPVKYTTNKGNSGQIDAIVTSFEHDGMQVVVGLENNSRFYGVQIPEDDPESYVNSLTSSITAENPIKFRIIITNDVNSISYTSSFSSINTSVSNFENIIKDALSNKIYQGDLKVSITTQEQPQAQSGADQALKNTFDELLKAATEEEYEVWDKEKELKWLRKNLPFLSEKTRLQFVDGLIPIMGTDRKAWGKFNKGIITLSNIAIKGTLYHEAFHSVFHTLLSDRDRADIMKEAREKYGNKTAIQLEEELADAFMNYVIDQEDLSFGQKIIKFFKNLFIKVTHWKRSQDAINSLFEDIQNGKYKNIRPYAHVHKDTYQLEQDIENSNIKYINKTNFYSLKESLQTLLKSKGITPNIYNNMTKEEQEYLRDCINY